MAVWEYSMYGQLTTKITAAVLATVIVVALLVPVVMSVSTEYTSAYNSGQRYSTDIDGEHQIGIAKNGVSYEITTDGNANPSPTFIDTDVDPDPQQSVQPTPGPSRSPLRGEPVRAVPTQNNNTDYAYLMTYDTTTSQITGVYKDGNIASKTNPETGVHQGQSGSWTWSSTTGLGPFNMYYQAVNTVDHTAYSDVENGKIGHVAYVLDPADLTKVIIGGQSTTSANFSSHLSEYNIMLVIPTVYWYSDGAGNLYISNTDSNSYIPSQVNAKMNAYAHTVNGTMSGDKITGGDVYEYIMIGVYEAYSDPTLGMTSQSGVTPTASKTIYDFRSDVATANARITDGQGTYVQWNFYQYTLYKMIAQAQMGNKDSQQTIGQGNTGGSAQSTTGLGNAQGPYADSTTYSKLFIENSWGSLNEFVDNTYCSERVVKAGSGLTPVSDSSSFTIDGTDYTGGSTALPSSNGWITGSYEGSATWDIPKTSSSSAGSYQTNDRVYTNTGNCVLYVGGYWWTGADAGLSFWSSTHDLSYSYTHIGSRLAYYTAGDAPATVTITAGTGGTVDVQSLTVPVGTSVSASGNVLTIGSDTVTATPNTGYRFVSWTGIPASGTIDADTTLTATFEPDTYTVTITVNDANYGSVSQSTVTDVPSGTAVSASGNVLTVGTTPITATPAQATAQYTYAFSQWTNAPATVTADVTITATFTATVNQYTVTVNVNEPTYGTVSPASVTVDYGTSISASGNVLTIGSNTVTQTPTTATAQYTYSFDSWTGTTATVTGDMAVTANFTRATNDYTVTVAVNDANYGSVDVSSVTVPYGTAVSTADNVLTIGSTDVTQTPASPTQQYRYAFGSWQNAPQTVTADVTITAVFTQSPRDYIVTIAVNDPAYGTVDVQTVTVDYGATISAASNVLTVGSTDVTATANQPTAQYTFAFSSWSGVPAGGTVTDDLTVTAVFTATVNEYHVHIQVNDARQGSVDVSDLNVPYGTTMTVNDNVLTINTSPATVVTASVNAPTAQYTFQFTDWVNTGTVTGDVNVVARYTVITNEYTVTFAVNDSNYGYVTEASITALYGTSVTVDGSTVTVGPYDSTAYANDPTAQYTYAFVDWSGAPQTVTGDVTVTANFTRTVNQYTVQIVSNNTDYGTVDISSVTVDYGTSVTVSSNVLTVGSNTITATPATSTPQWTYAFSEWQNVPQAVTGDVTVTAVFTATHLVYTVTFVTNGGTPVTAQEVEQGQTAVRPADPYLFSYYLVNWYSDDALTTAYNFATPVTGDTIVYQGYAPDRYSLVAYGSDGLVVLFDRSGALVYVGGGEGNVLLATITQGSSYNLVLTDGEFTAGEETAKIDGFVHPRGNLAYGQNQWMNADSPFGVFGVMNSTTSGGADIGFSYAVTGIFGNHEDVVVEQSYGDRINSIECAQEIVDARVSGATVSIVTEDSDSASYTDAYILAPYEIRTYNPDYVGDTLATLLMAIAVFCVLGIIAMVGYNRVKG